MEQYVQRRLDSPEFNRAKQVWKAEWDINAKLAAGALELDTLTQQFEAGLERVRMNTTRHLKTRMQQSESAFLKRFSATATALDLVLAPTRDAVRKDIARIEKERADQLRERALRRANSRGYARTRNAMAASGWSRTGKRVAQRTHPVLVANDASAFIISLLLMILVADIASREQLVAAGLWGEQHELAARCWWLLMGADLLAYLVSSAIILANAGAAATLGGTVCT